MTEDAGDKSSPKTITPIINDASEADFHRRFKTDEAREEARAVNAQEKADIKAAQTELDKAADAHIKKTAPRLVPPSVRDLIGAVARAFIPNAPSRSAQAVFAEKIKSIQTTAKKAREKIEKFQHAPKLKKAFLEADPKGRAVKAFQGAAKDNPVRGKGKAENAFRKAARPNVPKQEAGKATEAFRSATREPTGQRQQDGKADQVNDKSPEKTPRAAVEQSSDKLAVQPPEAIQAQDTGQSDGVSGRKPWTPEERAAKIAAEETRQAERQTERGGIGDDDRGREMTR